ncbi:4-(cytidine 5'-diphospho)-2-C-methyl-D-erythritol kinase [Rathayibacter rathayi]|uniref:4-diphosphocytidyl-2-C-methyl-D-erythritol kinase n=1 Tax=Rathayibacter rathayi TaxID=33887 RepID=A0ABD6W657_RATRA|nr:4-(cytidine 5'-diphospho)-2-C-methyl-D-erythritol kinase [Rathayibacter rathayi]AZZ49397.1 4-(cytidine 5'-diphospho)-2-C-methyl-D-erythritol kinase [Rathayibacter rathayi]MWV73500.1 4-(cytidine 5'-diphospho)-2-C-methyl-D-erythritol kinase [Rathayibacter rathayi NCPPB 2980 = VKM Ac-1601]PPF11286.1 4-(cytidine 5'-diphospho)-2-C-methyl-D-erythritol kinase [Rathayibacter rathayi]PPF21199.1 4-(cytidine 5'-diphospho)-2-C-methyl-D-erythritol kinase [Rathayibacter rathayi]PPF45041.1 4-(cytidine 5'-
MAHRATSNRVHARAPGKINVFLKVGAVRDDGYHELATAFQSLSLYEDVFATDASDFSVAFSGSIDSSALAVDGSNLAIKAARALARATGYRGGVHLEIEKHVPIAGGMGGGSADAAATLLACDALWGTACTREQLLGIAASLGADVPFSFTGGTAIGVGRGDELSPALAKGRFEWVLVLSDQGLSTPEVYSELDRHRERHLHDFRPISATPIIDPNVLQALRAGDAAMLADAMHNDLQAPALHLQPGLARILELGEGRGALGGLVSGSGPTVAFLASNADAALDLQLELSSARLRAVRVTGPVHGARVLSS